MTTDIVMPNMGFDTQDARLVEWLKQPGESVVRGEPLAVIESDKANVELESVVAGVVLSHLFEAGDEVTVGTVIGRVGARTDVAAPVETAVSHPPEPHPTQIIEASPLAKRIAADNQIDLALVKGSGPRGRIKRDDVEAYLRAQTITPLATNIIRALPKVRKAARVANIDLAKMTPTGYQGSVTLADLAAYQTSLEANVPEPVSIEEPVEKPQGAQEVPVSRIRQIIGKRLGDSKREAPHFYVTGEFDLETAVTHLQSMPSPQPGLNDLIQYLVVQTLQRVPALNATYVDGKLYQWDTVQLAIAIARDDGLITPIIPKADRYSLTGLAAESRELIQRTRANRLQSADLQPGTFTISNLGVIKQVDQFTAVINPPQVAILAVGTVKPRPVVINGGLHVHQTVHLTLSGDHRVVDGMHLGQFMAAFQKQLDYFSQG